MPLSPTLITTPSSRMPPRFVVASSILGLFLMGAAPLALAGSFGGSAGLATDKVVRGRSESEGQGVAFGDVQYVTDDRRWTVFAGLAAWRGPQGHGRSQNEARAGFQRQWDMGEDWSSRAGWTRYAFPRPDSEREGYDEWSATLAWRDTVFLGVLAIPSLSYRHDGGVQLRQQVAATELLWTGPAWGPVSTFCGVGHERLHGGGVREVNHYASLGISYVDAPVQPSLTLIGSRLRSDGVRAVATHWVFSVLASF
jgi:hypothetical protein